MNKAVCSASVLGVGVLDCNHKNLGWEQVESSITIDSNFYF
jgi:hypothetical protein